MEFGIRVSKDWVTLTSVPKDYGKKGFVKRLPIELSKRPKDLVAKFLGVSEMESGLDKIFIEPNRNGSHVV